MNTVIYVNLSFHGQFITALFSSLLLITLPTLRFRVSLNALLLLPRCKYLSINQGFKIYSLF